MGLGTHYSNFNITGSTNLLHFIIFYIELCYHKKKPSVEWLFFLYCLVNRWYCNDHFQFNNKWIIISFESVRFF
jgi:hypothetical protein